MSDLTGYFDSIVKFQTEHPKTVQRQAMKEKQKERAQKRKEQDAVNRKLGIKKKESEAELQKKMIEHFLSKGFMVIRHNSFMQFSEASGTPMRAYVISNTGGSSGLADITVAKNGRLAYIEVKIGRNKQTDSQEKFEKICTKYGMPYCVANSIEIADKFINKIFNN